MWFYGSHLVDLLIKDNHTVLVIDNLYSGSKKNIEAHKNYSNLYFKNICITDIVSLNKLFKGYDGIFHLAGLADIVPSIENPQQYYVDYSKKLYNLTLELIKSSKK